MSITPYRLFLSILLISGFARISFSQPANIICSKATIIPTPVSDDLAHKCVDGTNKDAFLYPHHNPGCAEFSHPVVWYQVTTDSFAGLLNIKVTSKGITYPAFQVFSSCDIENNSIPNACASGKLNSVSLTGFPVQPLTTYYIAVSNTSGSEGAFSICANTFRNTSVCNKDKELVVVSTSKGSPLYGPYKPGETVSFKYTVRSFVTFDNDCQWLQAIVPIFGNGWDPSSFKSSGIPKTSTPPPNLYWAQWKWFKDSEVKYFQPNPRIFKQKDTVTGNIKLCSFIDTDCDGTPLTPETKLPAGWYAYMPNQGDHPNQTYGDGTGCNSSNGPWEVTFSLTTRPFEGPTSCSVTGLTDCSVSMFTFSDGEIGLWGLEDHGDGSVCGADLPRFIHAENICCGEDLPLPIQKEICSGDNTNILIDSTPSPFSKFKWNINAPAEVGGAFASNGTKINQFLYNNSKVPQIVYYYVVDEANCEQAEIPVKVTVNPKPVFNLESPEGYSGCPESVFHLNIDILNALDTSVFFFNWSTGDTTQNLILSPDSTQVYTVLVTNAYGCTSVSRTTININPELKVDIHANPNDTTICLANTPLYLSFTHDGGAAAQQYAWETPGGLKQDSVLSIQSINESGKYKISLTDENGCSGKSEINISVLPSPQVQVQPYEQNLCKSLGFYTFKGLIVDSLKQIGFWNNQSISAQSFDNGKGELSVNLENLPEGQYTISYHLVDSSLCSDSMAVVFNVQNPPQIQSISTQVDHQTVRFESVNNNVTTYRWDFGDGESSTGAKPLHRYAKLGTYNVSLQVDNACSMDKDSILVNIQVIATNDVDSDDDVLSLYPNPATDQVLVKCEQCSFENMIIKMIDLSGKTVYYNKFESVNPTVMLPLAGLPSGSYIVSFVFENKVIQKKLVKL